MEQLKNHPVSMPPVIVEVPADSTALWYVLQTKSRQEKAVANDCQAHHIEHYLPLVKQIRYYGKRKAQIDLPLFSGYVFMRGQKDELYEIDRTRRIANIIDVPDQKKLAWELQNIQLALENEVTLDAYPSLVKGVMAEVKSGPFKGIQGIVEDRPRPDLLILQVETLGRAVSLTIDPELLEVIEKIEVQVGKN